jgi:hypothetical protein
MICNSMATFFLDGGNARAQQDACGGKIQGFIHTDPRGFPPEDATGR